jgi:hypothetical protein
MITTCTRHLSVEATRAIVSGLDDVFAPGPARLNGFFARRCRVEDVTTFAQPDLKRPPSAPPPSRRYQSAGYRVKRLLLGLALTTSQLVHERVSKRVALAVFSLGSQPTLFPVRGT